jgi:DHA1 family tetracycline resistance protein-like MFS transporter
VLFYSRFAFSSSVLGYFLAYFGISVILTQVFLVPRIITLADDAVVLRDGLLSVFVGLLILYFAPSWHWLILGTPILALGTALSYTMITSLLSFRSESTDQGEVLGINTSVQSLGFALPGLFSGLIAAYLSAGAPIALAGTFVLFAAAIVFFSKELKPRKDTILK